MPQAFLTPDYFWFLSQPKNKKVHLARYFSRILLQKIVPQAPLNFKTLIKDHFT